MVKKSVNEIPSMGSELDDIEQHSCKSGVPQSQTNIVYEVAKKPDVDLDPNDLSVSRRLPTEKDQSKS